MGSTTVITARTPSYASTPLGKVLGSSVDLRQTTDINALCERVATLYLQPGSEGRPAIALSINGERVDVPHAFASNVPTDPHQLRVRGLEFLREVVNTVGLAFVAAGVPEDVAYSQAEDIASQLGREVFLKVGEGLHAVLKGQKKYQQGIDVSIKGAQVWFHKTTTFVAKPPDAAKQGTEQAPAGRANPMHEAPIPASDAAATEGKPPVVGAVEVTVVFEPDSPHSCRQRADAKRFGTEKKWVLRASVTRAEVLQCDPTVCAELRRDLGTPEPTPWWALLAELYRTLETFFGEQGIVFSERNAGRGADCEPPSRSHLDGMENFGARAWAVSAQQRGGQWGDRSGYQLHEGVVLSDETPLRVSQQMGNPQRDAAAERASAAAGEELANSDFETFMDKNQLDYKRNISASHLSLAERRMREKARLSEATVLKAVREDIYRNLFNHRNYLKLNDELAVDVRYYDAFDEVFRWVPEDPQEPFDRKYKITEVPPKLRDWLEALELKFSIVSPSEIAQALKKKATEAVIEKFRETFPDPNMQRLMLVAITQHFDLATGALATASGLPPLGGSDVRTLHIQFAPPPKGPSHEATQHKGPLSAMIEYCRWRKINLEDRSKLYTIGSHVLDASAFERGETGIFSSWRVTPQGFTATKARVEAQIVRNQKEDGADSDVDEDSRTNVAVPLTAEGTGQPAP